MLMLLFMLLLNLPLHTISSTVEIQIHYPASQIQPLSTHAIFNLVLCYQPGCTASDALWNQTIPGSPLNPLLTIFQDDYRGNDLYVKEIALDNMLHSSTVFVTIYAAYDTPGNPYSRCAVKDYCNKTAHDPVSNHCVHVGMPFRSVLQQHSSPVSSSVGVTLLVVAFPYFAMEQGSVHMLLHNLYSPQLDNFRNINVYVPSSLHENPLRREVNVLIINDGTLYFLKQLAFVGGMDHGVLMGAVPETIMVGLPQNESEYDCQRQLELTFSVASAPTRCGSVKSGGTHLYLSFIKNNVVPAVLTALNILPESEISMAGVSYGGLTACYAASAMPEYFRRAFCQSPSVWWNYGDFVRSLSSAATNVSPLAVVVSIGSIEMGAPLCSSISCTSTTSWFTYVNNTVEAFRMAYGTNLSLHFFTLAGGKHDATAWATTFAAGITEMFAATKTNTFQMQYNEAVNVVFPPNKNADCPQQPASADGWVVLLAVLLLLESICIAIAVGWFIMLRRGSNNQDDVKEYSVM